MSIDPKKRESASLYVASQDDYDVALKVIKKRRKEQVVELILGAIFVAFALVGLVSYFLNMLILEALSSKIISRFLSRAGVSHEVLTTFVILIISYAIFEFIILALRKKSSFFRRHIDGDPIIIRFLFVATIIMIGLFMGLVTSNDIELLSGK